MVAKRVTWSRHLWPWPGRLPESSQAEADAFIAECVSFLGRVTGCRAGVTGVSAWEVSLLPLYESQSDSQQGLVPARLPGAGGAEGRSTSGSMPSPGVGDKLR